MEIVTHNGQNGIMIRKLIEVKGMRTRMNILIVDDEVFTVRAMQTTLDWKKLGIDSVFSAYNVEKAKEIIEREKIDLMICDIEMPKEDGISLATWLRERDDQKEIIFLTCHSEFEYAQKALKLKALDYIVMST